jgi:hypothetical protein
MYDQLTLIFYHTKKQIAIKYFNNFSFEKMVINYKNY